MKKQFVCAATGGKRSLLQKFQGTAAIAITAVALGGCGLYLGVMAQDMENQASATSNAAAAELAPAGKALVAASQAQTQAARPYIDTVTDSATASPFGKAAMMNAYLDQRKQHTLPRAIQAGLNTNMEMPEDYVPSNFQGTTRNAPFDRIHLAENASGQRAIQLLGADLNKVAAWYGMSSQDFAALLLNDSSIEVDHKGRVLHMDA